MSSSIIIWMAVIYVVFCWWPVIIVPITRSDIQCRLLYRGKGYHSSWDLIRVLLVITHAFYAIVVIAIIFFTVVCACVGYIIYTFTV